MRTSLQPRPPGFSWRTPGSRAGIAGRARRFGLTTDATSASNAAWILQSPAGHRRATALLIAIAGGRRPLVANEQPACCRCAPGAAASRAGERLLGTAPDDPPSNHCSPASACRSNGARGLFGHAALASLRRLVEPDLIERSRAGRYDAIPEATRPRRGCARCAGRGPSNDACSTCYRRGSTSRDVLIRRPRAAAALFQDPRHR